MLARLLLPFLLAAAGVSPAAAQTELTWKFKPGEVFFVETKQTTFATITIRGLLQPQDLEQTTVSRFKVLEVLPDGQVVLERTIVAVQFKNEAGLPDAAQIAGLMKGMTFKLTLDPKQRRITKLEGHEDFIKRLASLDENAARTLQVMMPPAVIIASLEAEFFHTPDRPVQKGDQWTNRFKLPMGPLGNLTGENLYRLDEVQGTKHKFSYTTKATLEPPPPDQTAPGGVKFTGSALDLKEAKGTATFDAATGHVTEASVTMKFAIKLTAESRGEPIDMVLNQTSTQTTRFLDKNPLAKP